MEYFWDSSETIVSGVGFSHYDMIHLGWLSIFAVTVVLCSIWYRKMSDQGRGILKKTLALTMITMEALKVLLLAVTGRFRWGYLPFHLCGINIFLIIAHAWKPSRMLDNFLYLICIPGALAALLFPNWTDLPLANIYHIHSSIIHILLVLYPLMQAVNGKLQLHVKYIAVGPDFRFGYNRKGSAGLLKQLASVYGYEVEVLEKECLDDKVISSTYVRHMLEIGEMEKVHKLLGYPYYVSGTVVHGHAIGRTLGIPTINLIPDEEKMLPPNGVYLTKTMFGHENYFGITNIGVKPTISGEELKGIETHLFDFDGNLYDQQLLVAFYAFERPERRFESLEELQKQLKEDVRWGEIYSPEKCKEMSYD